MGEIKFTDKSIYYRLRTRLKILSIHVRVPESNARRYVKRIGVYANNRPVGDVNELRSDPAALKKIAVVELEKGAMSSVVKLPTSTNAMNILIDFEEFYPDDTNVCSISCLLLICPPSKWFEVSFVLCFEMSIFEFVVGRKAPICFACECVCVLCLPACMRACVHACV